MVISPVRLEIKRKKKVHKVSASERKKERERKKEGESGHCCVPLIKCGSLFVVVFISLIFCLEPITGSILDFLERLTRSLLCVSGTCSGTYLLSKESKV